MMKRATVAAALFALASALPAVAQEPARVGLGAGHRLPLVHSGTPVVNAVSTAEELDPVAVRRPIV